MWYPQNPKVLIIDDEINEVLPLLNILSRNGVPYAYFDGGMDSIPEKPFTGVRLVILDIDLKDRTSGQNDKGKASSLAAYLDQLMTIQDSFYVILFWTKHEEIIKETNDYLATINGAPLFFLNMEKPALSKITIDYVKDHFFDNLNNEAFEFLVNWENFLTQNTSIFTNKLSRIAKQDSMENRRDWTDSIKSILGKMACSYIGKTDIRELSDGQAASCAMKILNQSFYESLSTDLSSKISLTKAPNISLKTIADLNGILFIEKAKDDRIENGKIFCKDDDKHLHYLLMHKILTKQFREFIKSNLIGVVLTPCCDIAHNKFLKDSLMREYHRILYGLKISIRDETACYFEHNACAVSNRAKMDKIIETEETFITDVLNYFASKDPTGNVNSSFPKIKDMQRNKSAIMKLKKAIFARSPDSLYITQPFLDESNMVSLLVFHFGTLQTEAIDPQSIHFSYFMKNNVISDLQTKFANHVNRLGSDMIEYDIN